MIPTQTHIEVANDPLYHGYRERTRALLRHLILEKGYCPSHPLVTSFDHHLYLTTAYAEYSRALEQAFPAPGLIDMHNLRQTCFRGTNLRFQYCDRTATSIMEDYEEKPEKYMS